MREARPGIGQKLWELRKQHKYSREYLSKMIGRSGGQYKRFESEGVLPNFKILAQLIQIYGVSADELLGDYIPTIEDVLLESDTAEGRHWVRKDVTRTPDPKVHGIGRRLKEIRKQHNYTQEMIAKRIGVSRNNYAKFENNMAEPGYPQLVRLMRIYGVSAASLLRDYYQAVSK